MGRILWNLASDFLEAFALLSLIAFIAAVATEQLRRGLKNA